MALVVPQLAVFGRAEPLGVGEFFIGECNAAAGARIGAARRGVFRLSVRRANRVSGFAAR